MLLLWGFYVLFLERESMHYTKRFYLIFSVIFALTIPLITFTYQTDVIIEPKVIEQPITTMVMSDEIPVIVETPINYLSLVLWGLYIVGVVIFGFRFIKNLKNLTKKIKNNERLIEPSHINVLVGDSIIPHTFLKYIFVSKKEYQEHNIPEEVLLHEKTHVTQKHTLDILFVEILQVVFWFNPLFFFIKKSIKLNHEFLADQTVLKRQFSLQKYMSLLVTYPNSSNQTELASPINYSLTKKRIVMMSQQFSKTRAAARMLLLLPTLLGCMLLFNNKIVAQQTNVKYTKTVQDTHPDKKIKLRVKNDQIVVNGTTTNLSGFASTINEMTKQWKDDELTEFQFDIQIKNSDDSFVEKLNDEYRKTRLYNANPDGHDLIPPPPPLPEIPNIKTGVIPSPPSGSKTIEVEESIISPPAPPKAPSPPINPRVELDEIENEVELSMEEAEQARIELEQARIEAEVEREFEIANALEAAEHARVIAMEEAEMGREMAMVQAEHARAAAERAGAMAMEAAHRSRKHHQVREEAMQHAQLAREEAQKARVIAMEEARKAHKRVKLDSDKLREEARIAAEKARKHAEKARKETRKAAEEARKEARKEMEKVRKEREKARKKAKKEKN